MISTIPSLEKICAAFGIILTQYLLLHLIDELHFHFRP